MIKKLIEELANYQATDRVIPWERERASASLSIVLGEARQLLTWQEIGDALGVNRQAAQARLGPFLSAGPSAKHRLAAALPVADQDLKDKHETGATLVELAAGYRSTPTTIWRRINRRR